MLSRTLRFAPLLLLLVACDKKVINERVNPPRATGPSKPSSGLNCDAGLVCGDAGVVADAQVSEFVEDGPTDFSKPNLLVAIGGCALAAYGSFAERAGQLETATRAWADDASAENQANAIAAFKAAMSAFQWAEVFRFGPMASGDNGQNLRAELYSYPNKVTCGVDQLLVSQAYNGAGFASGSPTLRGLDALEYLLFYQGTQNACSASSAINVNGTWAPLAADQDELKRRRAAYASAVASQIALHAQQLVNAFSPKGDDFLKQFTSAGHGSKAYPSEQAALNAVSDALFYIDLEVKDSKLALPLGLSMDCTATSCPDAVESPFAQLSTSNIARNLGAFRAIFQGCARDHSGLGFDDWLSAVKQDTLANKMVAALEQAQAQVDALGAPLETVIVQDLKKARDVHTAIKQLTDLMKADFTSVLELMAPPVVGTDND